MKKQMYKTEGVINKKISDGWYEVKLKNNKGIKIVRFSGILRIHYQELSIGAKVHVELPTDETKMGRILSATDFKLNGLSGWTDEYEPK